jgi:hypothetical protein
MLFKILSRLVIGSALITSNPKFHSDNKLYSLGRYFFRLKYSPLALDRVLDPKLFTRIVASLSIGGLQTRQQNMQAWCG